MKLDRLKKLRMMWAEELDGKYPEEVWILDLMDRLIKKYQPTEANFIKEIQIRIKEEAKKEIRI